MHKRLFKILLLVLPLVASGVVRGQVAPEKKLAFDVATVKPAAPLDMQQIAADIRAGRAPKVGPQVGADRATYTFMPLDQLIALAYKVRVYQISGPPWLSTERFDIEAKLPDGATRDDVPAMLQALLEDRFKLVAHQAQEEHKVLALVVGKSGIKVKESTVTPQPIDPNAPLKPGERQWEGSDGPGRVKIDPDGTVHMNMGAKGTVAWKRDPNQSLHLESDGLSMPGFAEMMSYLFLQMDGANSRQVVDMTGIKGFYPIDIEISLADLRNMARAQGATMQAAPANNANAIPEASDPGGGLGIYEAVSQMGLKLEERKANVQRLVIDHVEKTPTEN